MGPVSDTLNIRLATAMYKSIILRDLKYAHDYGAKEGSVIFPTHARKEIARNEWFVAS